LSFLACAQNPDNAELVLTLAERLPEDTAQKVFAKYAEIARGAEKLKELVTAEFPNTELPDRLRQKIIADLFVKAEKLLKTSAADLQEAQKPTALLTTLDAYRGEVALYTSTVGELIKSGQTDMAEILQQNLTITQSQDLSADERREMSAVFVAGRKGSYPKTLQARSRAKYEAKLAEPDHTFYVLERKDHPIVSFHADADPKDPEGVLVGGFNLSPDATGPLAAAMIKAWLNTRTDKNVRGDVLASNERARQFYLRSLGFQEDHSRPPRVEIDENGERHPYLNIIRPKKTVGETPPD